jgi:isochorismate pyruvate lyase
MMTMQTLWADLEGSSAAECQSMQDVRREIDRVDRALVRLLAQRLTYIERAGQIKKDRSTVRDDARIRDVLEKVKASCVKDGFPCTIAEPVWTALMEGCIAHEFVVYDDVNASTPKAALAV